MGFYYLFNRRSQQSSKTFQMNEAHEDPINFRYILHSSLLTFLIASASYCIDYGLNVVLAKILNPAEYGDYSVAMSMAIFWTTFAMLGGPKSITKFFPVYAKNKDKAHGTGLILFYITISCLLGISVALIGLLLAYADVHGFKKMTGGDYHPLTLALFMLPLIGLSNIYSAVLRSRNKFLWSALPTQIILPALFLLLIWGLTAYGISINDWGAILLMTLSYFLLAVLQFFLVRKIGKIDYVLNQTKIKSKEWLHLSIPLMFGALLFYLMQQLNLIMVEMLSSSEDSVGYYAAVSKAATLLFVFSNAVSAVMPPMISLAIEKNQKTMQHLHVILFWLNTTTSALLLLILCLWGKDFLSLFGSQYIHANLALSILAAAYFFNNMGRGSVNFMQFTEFAKLSLTIDIVFVILNIILNWILIPVYDLNGVALATAICMMLNTLVRMVFVWNKMGLTLFAYSK